MPNWLSITLVSVLGFIVILLLLFILIYKKVDVVTKNMANNTKKLYDDLNKSITHSDVVFLGDSITEFYRMNEFFHNIDIYNRGIAGDTTDDVLARMDENVVCMNPKKLFLQIGTNDLGIKKTVDYIINNINKIISKIKTSLPRTKLYIISVFPVNSVMSPYNKIVVGFRKNKDLDEINDKLKLLCDNMSLPFIDISPILKDEKGNLDERYTYEGLHISSLGYTVITEQLKPYVLDEII